MASIQLPGANLIQGYSAGGEGSIQAAGAPWGAIAGVGEMVQQQGEHLSQVAVKLQRVENFKMAADMELKATELFSQFQLDSLTDGDPKGRPERWQKTLDAFKKQAMPSNLAPEQQAMLGQKFAEFASTSTMNVTKGSVIDGIKESNATAENLLNQKVNMGDGAGAHRVIDEAQANGLYSSAEAEKKRQALDQQLQVQSIQTEAQDDPLQTKAALQEKNEDGTWKNYPGIDPGQRAQLMKVADQQYRSDLGSAVDEANNLMASGQIHEGGQIDEMYGGILSPVAIEELKKNLANRRGNRTEAIQATPDYQNHVVGQVSLMLKDYNPQAEGYDRAYTEMDSLVRTLPDGSAKAELNRQLSAAREGKKLDPSSHFDSGLKTMDEAFDQFYKPKFQPYTQPVDRIVASGFLSKENLTGLGLPADVVEKILGEEGRTWTGSKKTPNTPAEREKLFKETASPIWKVGRGKITASDRTQKAAEAILNGESNFVYTSPEATRDAAIAEVAAVTRFGKDKADFLEWRKANPEASSKEIDDKVLQLSGATVRAERSTSFIQKPNLAAPGDRITSYGYASDSTPDRNSAAGIGAWVSDGEAKRIKGGEETVNKLKEGDFAVSPDVERQLRAAGITPGSSVKIQVSDGSTVNGRWMDRTAAEYNGKPLKGRWDIYSPNGKHALDGKTVRGWLPGAQVEMENSEPEPLPGKAPDSNQMSEQKPIITNDELNSYPVR